MEPSTIPSLDDNPGPKELRWSHPSDPIDGEDEVEGIAPVTFLLEQSRSAMIEFLETFSTKRRAACRKTGILRRLSTASRLSAGREKP